MLTRRHLRIKVLQILYGFYQSEERDSAKARRELKRSIEKIYELYIAYLLIFGELLNLTERDFEQRRGKHLPINDDLNPDRKFADNLVLKRLAEATVLKRMAQKLAVNWEDVSKQKMIRQILDHIRASANYGQYMESSVSSFERDSAFVQNVFTDEIANFEHLQEYFEEQSIFWTDDIDLVCTAVLKTIRTIDADAKVKLELADLHRDKKDELNFVKELLEKTMSGDAESEILIRDLAKNWDLDRLAKIDIILLKMALTEFTSLSSVPKKVTLNEYIEISKYYSTPKSQMFINGILDKAVLLLEKEGKLIKTGRGLIE